MKITLTNLQERPLTVKTLKRLAGRILKYAGVACAELSIVFVNSRLIRRLNSQFLKEEHSTDVLSFDLAEKKEKVLRGEIIISTDAA
ncbi:MAG: rRNA maturation RNase YbeY, partial [Candidatus Omnitrophota bacterium]